VLFKERQEEKRQQHLLKRQAAADALKVGRRPARPPLEPQLETSAQPTQARTTPADVLRLETGR
jgi:hypothetical protein